MADETDTTSEVARVRAVTEFHVTYFGLSELEADALLDLYADHAYKFAERHKHETPLIGSRSWPTEEAWEGDVPRRPQIATQEPAGQPEAGSAGRGASGGLGERLRALGTGQARALRKELRAMADEVDRLEGERDDLSAALKRVCFGDMRGIKWGGEEWTNTADIRAAIEGTAAEKNENEEAP